MFCQPALCTGTKYAVRAITDGLRQEVMPDIRVTLISPGLTQTELDGTITDAELKRSMEEWRSRATRSPERFFSPSSSRTVST